MEVQAAASGDAVLAALPVLHQSGNPTADVLTGASLVTTQPVAAAVVQRAALEDLAGRGPGRHSASPIGQASLVAVQATASSAATAAAAGDGFVDQTIALSTARMHAAIARELPTLEAQLASVPAAQRYGPGSLGAQVDELRQLQLQNDPDAGQRGSGHAADRALLAQDQAVADRGPVRRAAGRRRRRLPVPRAGSSRSGARSSCATASICRFWPGSRASPQQATPPAASPRAVASAPRRATGRCGR